MFIIKITIFRLLLLLTVQNLVFVESRRVKRVIGGTEVACGTQIRCASLLNASNSHHLCGATLISSKIALTAAHCVEYEPKNYRLLFKNYCVNDEIDAPSAQVLEIITHPLFNRYSRAHDIAVLRLQCDLDDITRLNDTVLPVSSFGISGECVIYGYGYKDVNTEEMPQELLAGKLSLVSLDDCTEALGEYVAPKYDSGLMCAVGEGVDACQGDSGGPLMCGGKLEGISTYGLSCGVPGIPGVYVSIGAHLQWLKNVIKDIES